MKHSNQSMLSALAEFARLSDLLGDAVITLNRANIVRLCSNIQHCLADITEHAIPDGFEVDVKLFNVYE